MIERVFRTSQFKRDVKALLRKHYSVDKLQTAIETLKSEDRDSLITKYRDHALSGNWHGFRGIHVEGDWLIIYRIERKELMLVLTRTGSHDDLF